jgi:hypothetical protein
MRTQANNLERLLTCQAVVYYSPIPLCWPSVSHDYLPEPVRAECSQSFLRLAMHCTWNYTTVLVAFVLAAYVTHCRAFYRAPSHHN